MSNSQSSYCLCVVCKTPVDSSDNLFVCPACELPFHRECWDENLGCAAYGCKMVNHLKPTKPDITVSSVVKTCSHCGKDIFSAHTLCSQCRNVPYHDNQVHYADETDSGNEFPLDFLFLGLTFIFGVIGIFTSGIPSLLFIVFSYFYTARKRIDINRVIGFAWVLSIIFFMIGNHLSSTYFSK